MLSPHIPRYTAVQLTSKGCNSLSAPSTKIVINFFIGNFKDLFNEAIFPITSRKTKKKNEHHTPTEEVSEIEMVTF